eukprot:CAMPEP_0114429166 /NCGR_PEP_ID=MMETSP0103-20121206/9329_1 /TAXON_ID=37642 ORGANISM="Paraphysomonas imperforata, Strain PA2" /NCGR_SAMPLE_ID=MMETSP0103 /ASSEMBLY_ACC=CAM_ASM_000201 /LENGTH=361 /DNA_ID=CAMNT_0001598461 /DNA_START=24 /DNA_END=1109 /DNA_ORIENTATION=+
MGDKSSSRMSTVMWIVGLAVLVPVMKTLFAGDPLSYMYPNMLLFTPFREEAKAAWKEVLVVDTAVKRAPTQIPEINAEDYSFESLRAATDNFRHPAVVRGFFKGTNAAEKWMDPEYLNAKIGDYEIPVVMKAEYNTGQNERSVMPFRDAYTDILKDENSKKYLFFPVKSRENFNHSKVGTNAALMEKINEVVHEDLDLDRIWKGFGGSNHRTFFGSQLVVGRGSNDSDATTGTGWHCAVGNNWFAQVAGTKRWYFMDPEYSAYMSPLRGGKVNMQTSHTEMHLIQDNIPLRYSDIYAGDLLYNPDWEWHTIKNYEGLAIGVPIREMNLTLSLRNNFQYTSIIIMNKVAEKLGIDIGGYALQ